jgi:ribosome-binding protein aMBF1 (putative translation factor)
LIKGVKMDKYLDPEIYNKYKQQVLDMSLAVQYYVGVEQQRESSCLSDGEIAQRLGLSVQEVSEIRTIAENDLMPADTWMKSDEEKRRKAKAFFSKRLHSASEDQD